MAFGTPDLYAPLDAEPQKAHNAVSVGQNATSAKIVEFGDAGLTQVPALPRSSPMTSVYWQTTGYGVGTYQVQINAIMPDGTQIRLATSANITSNTTGHLATPYPSVAYRQIVVRVQETGNTPSAAVTVSTWVAARSLG